MKNSIPIFLQEKLDLAGTARASKFPEEIVQFMKSYDTFYKWNLNGDVTKIFKAMKQRITHLPICGYEGCDKRVYFDYETKLTKGCCREHSLKINNIEKLGVESNMHTSQSKTKLKNTCLEKYGVENPFQNEMVKNKMKETCMKKFGVDNIFKDDNFKSSIKKQNIEKYGVEYAFQAKEIKEKSKKTMLEKYGVEYPQQSPDIQKNTIDTNRKKYNKNHPMHDPVIFEKTQKKCYKLKEYIWKTGEVSKVQGNEPIVLKELENVGYTFEEIVTKPTEMPEIFYFFNGVLRRYYPDIYIPAENKIIEVKSDYTLKSKWDMNQAKFEAAKKSNFDFKLEIRN